MEPKEVFLLGSAKEQKHKTLHLISSLYVIIVESLLANSIENESLTGFIKESLQISPNDYLWYKQSAMIDWK